MKIIFDGKEFLVNDASKNIIEIAKEHGVYIPAPCYYKNDDTGCCNGCIILVDGKEAHACETTPVEGMEIIYDCDDLLTLRTRNLRKYSARSAIAEKLDTSKTAKSGCGGHGKYGDACTCED